MAKSKSSKTDFSAQYKALWESPFGADILRVLQELHDSKIQEAEQVEDNQDKAYGLLKEGSGVMLAITHIKSRGAKIVTKARGNREE